MKYFFKYQLFALVIANICYTVIEEISDSFVISLAVYAIVLLPMSKHVADAIIHDKIKDDFGDKFISYDPVKNIVYTEEQ